MVASLFCYELFHALQISDVKIDTQTVVDARMEAPPSFICILRMLRYYGGNGIGLNFLLFFFLTQLQHILTHRGVYFIGHAGCKHSKDSFTATWDLRIKIAKQLGVIGISMETNVVSPYNIPNRMCTHDKTLRSHN